MTYKVKPGAAAAAHGLRGIDLAGRQISPTNTGDSIGTQATLQHIIAAPTGNRSPGARHHDALHFDVADYQLADDAGAR